MEKFLVPVDPQKINKRSGQRRIDDLKKVVKLSTARNLVDNTELLRLNGILQDEVSTVEHLQEALRHLSCYLISAKHLEECKPVVASVKQLRQHSDKQVQKLAVNLIQKWKTDVLENNRRRTSKKS